MHADRPTLQLSQGKTQMKMPDDGDWGWRPDVFATWLGQMSSVVKSARHDVGRSIEVHHNDIDPELIVRQFKNMGIDDLASEATKGLTKTILLKWKAYCHWITQRLYSCD